MCSLCHAKIWDSSFEVDPDRVVEEPILHEKHLLMLKEVASQLKRRRLWIQRLY